MHVVKNNTKKEAAPPPPLMGSKDPMVDLKGVIDFKSCNVLNGDGQTGLRDVIGATGVLKSDADVDHQLLLNIVFTEAVKLHGIAFSCQKEGASTNKKESGPKRVKLFLNRTNIDFSEASSIPATQDFLFDDRDLTGVEKLTQFVRFQNVHSLTIFVESNQQNSEVTCLNRLSLIGTTIAGMRMSDLKKSG